MIFRLQIDKDREEEIVATVHKRTPLVDEIERLVTEENYTDRLPGYIDDEIRILVLDQVECFFSEDDKTYAVDRDNHKYLIKKRLYELEALLPKQFEKISRSAIANWDRIGSFKVQLSGAVDIVFKSGYRDCISRRCFAELKRRYGL